MEENPSNNQTEFNSSIATLKRIDDLMRQLHDLSRGLIPTNKFGYPIITGNPYQLYLDTTERLRVEGNRKFNKKPKEIQDLDISKEKINKIKERYGNNLYLKNISSGMPPHEHVNKEYYNGWNELLEANREYELKIVGYLDDHGMLMTNRDDASYALR